MLILDGHLFLDLGVEASLLFVVIDIIYSFGRRGLDFRVWRSPQASLLDAPRGRIRAQSLTLGTRNTFVGSRCAAGQPLENLSRLRVSGFGLTVSGIEIQGLGVWVHCFGVRGAGCGVQGARFGVQGAGCRVQGAGCRVQGTSGIFARRSEGLCFGSRVRP